MNIKFIYPVSNNNIIVIRSKKVGYIDRKWQVDQPPELLPYVDREDYQKSVYHLNRIGKFTLYGQFLSLLPSVLAGSVAFGVGEAKRQTEHFTPIYWYIGIILLAVSLLIFLIIVSTLKQKYLKNLAMQVAKEHTTYVNKYAISWSLRYVDFINKHGDKKIKVWCELTVPVSPLAQQPLVPYPNPYPNGHPNHIYNIPMQTMSSQQQQQQQQQPTPSNFYQPAPVPNWGSGYASNEPPQPSHMGYPIDTTSNTVSLDKRP